MSDFTKWKELKTIVNNSNETEQSIEEEIGMGNANASCRYFNVIVFYCIRSAIMTEM